MRSEFNERTWLAWLSKVRIIVITFLLAIELLILRLTATAVPEGAFLSVIALWYAIALFYVLLLPLWREAGTQARLQVVSDLVFANALIYLTGGIDTFFNFLNPLIIIMASILLSRTWAYLSALLSFILFGSILELSYFDLIHSYSNTRPDARSLQLVIFINLIAYLAVAYLASKMTARLRQVHFELEDKSGALQNLQALHKNVIDSMSGGLITTNLEGRVTLLNPAGEKLLETSAGAALGKPVAQYFLDPLPAIGPHLVRTEVRCLVPSGVEKTFGITASELHVPGRGLTGYVYAFADLTEVRRLEREVRMRDRLAAIGRMAGGIAHEIRNPLTSIAGSVQVLSGISELNSDQKALVEIVLRESDRLNAIITDFLMYAREKTYKMAVVDLVPLLDDTLKALERTQSAPRIEIVRRFETESAWVLADRDRIRQVFTILANHARRSMPEGGRLTVTLEPAQDRWHIRFADSGRGLTSQQVEKVFEPFQSEFGGGTGLGLAIAYEILQAHDARVSVHSSLGEGIEFDLELKRATLPRGPEPKPAAAAHASLRSLEAGGVLETPSGVKHG
ncbi:MAG TPA: ATP-binding protein [Terriglobales bacterium]|jgi:two-component system sensor histidine kinase PilS (NtrC family)|nr:ATP-binding protein [Terriglobales bacterium]